MILDHQGLPILDQFSDEGFVDCIFKISDLKRDGDFYYFDLFASHKAQKVGLAVKLVNRVGPGFDAEMNLVKHHVYDRGVSFRSLGQVSDDLITALAELYGHDSGTLRMVPEESFTMIALQQQDTDLEHHSVKTKLFGRDSDPFVEDDYYESFFNIDFPSGFVSWNEKDPDYRTPLIKALSATA
jgi:hypothetical protein